MTPQHRTYDPIAVANFFIQKSLDTGTEVTPMKLLKLVYIAHGWSLGLLGEPLIDEAVEAWTYGPVIPDLYRALKAYGRKRVTKLISKTDAKRFGLFSAPVAPPTIAEDDTFTQKLLANVWDAYGDKSGLHLSAITHKAGTPWSLTEHNDIIPQDLIRAHYQSLAQTPAQTPANA